jgi:uncharacterized membrane protein
MSQTNYSYNTSLPAFQEPGKEIQAQRILSLIHLGADCLLKLHEQTGLPQATCSGRVNDLIKEVKVMYQGEVIYKGRRRKRIALVTGRLFN